MGLGVTETYTNDICNKYATDMEYYQTIYPIGIYIFPIGYPLFPIGPWWRLQPGSAAAAQGLQVLPLHSQLSAAEQRAAFVRPPRGITKVNEEHGNQ